MIKVILVDDQKLILQSFRMMLDTLPDLNVVGECMSGSEVVAMYKQHQPDIVLLDLSMPKIDGIETAKLLLKENPECLIIGLSGVEDINLVIAMLRTGVTGFIRKSSSIGEVHESILHAINGGFVLSQPLVDIILPILLTNDRPRAIILTEKERETLRLITSGRSTKEAANDMNVSVRTIEAHRAHIMQKLKLDNLADLTRYSLKQGLISLD